MKARVLAMRGMSSPMSLPSGPVPTHVHSVATSTKTVGTRLELTEAVCDAIAALDWKDGFVAAAQKLDPSVWSKQKTRKDGYGIRLDKLEQLPPEFLPELVRALAARAGLRVVEADRKRRALARAMPLLMELFQELADEAPDDVRERRRA